MNKKQVAVVMGVLGLAVFAGIANAQSQLALIWENQCAGLGDGIAQLRVSADNVQCWGEISPVPPTETPVSPTDIPVSTPTPTGPWTGSPLCETHDDRAWHGLFDYERGCHYNHEHGMNPHGVDDIFGTQFYDWAGGEISYPWQTFRSPGGPGNMENDIKHEGYKWYWWRDESCFETETLCPVAGRIEMHGIFSPPGSVARFHSQYRELLICNQDTDECGIIRGGGWVDSGRLTIHPSPGEDAVYVPLPADDDISPNGGVFNVPSRKVHKGYPFEGEPQQFSHLHEWYVFQKGIFVTTTLLVRESFGPMSIDDPSGLYFYSNCGDNQECRKGNGSETRVASVTTNIPNTISNESGYTDRYGFRAPDCIEIGLDCVPYEFVDVPVGNFDGPDPFNNPPMFDGDIYIEEEYWIRYPN